jgi:two-component system response regulator YesN
MLPMFQRGYCDIRHALMVHNDCVSKLRQWGKDVTDLYLYSFDQLTDLFGDVREMIDYLKGLIWSEQDDQSVLAPLAGSQSFHTMLRYINESFCEDVSIQGLSKMFNVNANYISQLFRKNLDTTFTEYLSGLRLKRATELLKSTSIPINEIADLVGYKDHFYFSKLFKKTIGVSPKAFRNDRTQTESGNGS